MDHRSDTVSSRSVFAIGSHPPFFVFGERKLLGLPSHYGYGEIFKKQANRRTGPFQKTGQPPYVLAALPEPVPARPFTRRFLPLGTLMVIAMLPRRTYPFRTVIQFSRFTRSLKYRQICPYSTTKKGSFPDIQKDGKDP